GIRHAPTHDGCGEGAELCRVELRGPQLLLHLGVLFEECCRGHPFGAAGSLAQSGERRWVDAVLECAHREISKFGTEPPEHSHLWHERLGPCGAESVADAA